MSTNGGGIDALDTRPDVGIGGIATTRAESLSLIEQYLIESGVDLSGRSGREAFDLVRDLPGVDDMGLNAYGQDGLDFNAAVDQTGAAPQLFGDSPAEIGRGLIDIAANGSESTDRESGRRPKVLRRRLREAAREQVQNDPDLSLDDVTIDARVGELGAGEQMVIVQDPDTDRTETFDIDLDDGTDAAADSALDQFDPWSGSVAPAAGSTASGSSIGGAIAIAAAAVGLAAVVLGGN